MTDAYQNLRIRRLERQVADLSRRGQRDSTFAREVATDFPAAGGGPQVGKVRLWTTSNLNRTTVFTVPFVTAGGFVGNPDFWEFDASNRIEIGETGRYHLHFTARMEGSGAPRCIVAWGIFANGDTLPLNDFMSPSNRTDSNSGWPIGVSFSTSQPLTAGDYLEVKTLREGLAGDVFLGGSPTRPEAELILEYFG